MENIIKTINTFSNFNDEVIFKSLKKVLKSGHSITQLFRNPLIFHYSLNIKRESVGSDCKYNL